MKLFVVFVICLEINISQLTKAAVDFFLHCDVNLWRKTQLKEIIHKKSLIQH